MPFQDANLRHNLFNMFAPQSQFFQVKKLNPKGTFHKWKNVKQEFVAVIHNVV